MRLTTSTRLGLAALSLAALASCGASTQLTSSWSDPNATKRTYQKIAVVGVTPRTAARRMYEDDFVADLKARNVTAVQSYTFAGEGQIDKDAALNKLRSMGVDAIILTRLVDKETVQNYYPPTYSTMAAPPAYYGGWYGYYSVGYTYETSPGYVSESKVFRLETLLYDVNTDKLIWSGLTETTVMSGDAPEKEILPLITAITYDMEQKKVLPKRK